MRGHVRHPETRRWRAVVLVAALVLLAAPGGLIVGSAGAAVVRPSRGGAASLPAVLTGAGVTGTVSGASAGLAAIDVRIYDASSGVAVAKTVTAAGGSYSVPVTPGSYKVRFSDASGHWELQWYPGVTTIGAATPITVSSSGATTVDGVMVATRTRLGGQTETATDRIIPLPGIDVRVYSGTTGLLAAKTVSSAAGLYAIADLPAGQYRVRFSDPTGTYGLIWYPSVSSEAQAVMVSVVDGSQASADGLMYRAGQINGTVRNGSGGLAGIDVRLYDANTGGLVAKTVSGAGGAYVFAQLSQGAYGRSAYRVRFSDATGTYALQWYSGAAGVGTATVVTIDVRAGSSPGPLDALMLPAGGLSGRLTDGTNGVAGINVRIYAPGGKSVTKVTTDAAGHYTVAGLAAGPYDLDFGDPTDAWVPTWFHSATTSSTATPVTVAGGSTTAVPDQVMTPAVHLNLTVNSGLDAPDAHPGDGVCDDGTGHCTLRAAVDEANANPASDTITIAPGVNPMLTRAGAGENANATGDLDSRGTLTIHGGGATLNAGGVDRAIEQFSGLLSIDHLTITGGTTAGDHVAGQGDGGGAILVWSDLALTDCIIEGNHAVRYQYGRGGGVAVLGSLTMVGSSVTNNVSADQGGGVWVQGAATVVSDSTISGNETDVHDADPPGNNSAAALDVGSREEHAGTAVITDTTVSNNISRLNGRSVSGGGVVLAVTTGEVVNSTITGNAADVYPDLPAFIGGGAGVSGDAGPLALIDDTITDNTGYPGVYQLLPGGGAGPFTVEGSVVTGPSPVCNGAWLSLGRNIFSDSSCQTPVANVNDRIVSDPGLAPLANNGGQTATRLPLGGSPTLDAVPPGWPGLCDGTIATDQRGVSRPQGSGCDIGAVEVVASPDA
jgi:hypothetical protein